ncbi:MULTISPECIES: hypothetical protein [Streptomyces]|uniref:hypothetical protein n=1 Tax=Streptomyces lycopersici TaxID=2974589 RepID=UPI0021CE89E4|nr:hypothetical protein [Streptomyces sp. NEAU-383]
MGDGHAPGLSGREDVLGAGWESHRPAVFGVADILKSARFRRETYVGPWPPEPLLTGPDASEPVLVGESVRSAMLLIMEELSPPERVAFVPHDVFAAYEAGDLAGLVRLLVEVGGELAPVFHREGRVCSVDTLRITDRLITAYRGVINPAKLSHV